MNHIFSIARARSADTYDSKTDANPPVLVSANNASGGSGMTGGGIGSGSIVDVVNDFYWTYSKLQQARQEVPKIYLKELRLKTNALVSQLKYSYGVTADTINGVLQALPPELAATASGLFGKVDTAIRNVAAGIVPEAVDNNPIYDENPLLRPYRNLYITEPTGWEFIMPYFENFNNSQTNTFSQDPTNPYLGMLTKTAAGITDIASTVAMLRAPTQISFVEKSKFFNYNEEGDDITFMFPLINTGSVTYEDVVRNWELVFLLLYNNKPSRRDISIVEPPVLYQLEIPGVRFLPFCYVSQIAVDFQGSRRELDLDLAYSENLILESVAPNQEVFNIPGFSFNLTRNQLGSGLNNILGAFGNAAQMVRGFSTATNSKRIKAIIPDAYVIKITVKSLISDNKNFMFSMMKQNSLVTTSTVQGSDAADVNASFFSNIA